MAVKTVEVKDKSVSFKITMEEYQPFSELAAKKGITVSQYIRKLINDEVKGV